MAVAQDRAVVLEATQLGVEAVPGAMVAALKRLTGVYVEPAPNVPIAMHRAMGSLVATGEVMSKEWTAANLTSTDLNFRELIYLLAGVVGAPVGGAPITPTGAAATKRWTFRLLNWQASNPQTYTFEHGQNSNGFAERFGYGLINTLGCRSSDTDIALSGQIIGQQTIESVTITQGGPATANPTVAPALSATGTAASSVPAPTNAAGAAGGPTLTVQAGGGTLNGTYGLQYTFTNAVGETTPSPISTLLAVSTGGSILVGPVTLPAGATGVKWYASVSAGSSTTQLVASAPTNGSSWTLTTTGSGATPPAANTATYGGTTSLLAGTYTGAYTYADTTGETADITSTVTIAAGQSITFAPITGVPNGATVKYYLSPAAGNTAVQYTGVQNTGSNSQVFTTLPSGAATPPATSTTTATTVTRITDTPASPNKVAVWSGNSVAALAQHSRNFDSEWSISNRFGTIMTQDDRTNTYSAHVDKAPDVHITTTVELDSFGQSLMADLRAGTPKYVRWIVTGALIEAGFPFRCQVTMPAFLEKPAPKAQGDVYGSSYDWTARDDTSFGAIIEFVVDTDQATL